MGNVAKGILKGTGVSALTGLPIPFLPGGKKKKKGAAITPPPGIDQAVTPEMGGGFEGIAPGAGLIAQMTGAPGQIGGMAEMGIEEPIAETPRARVARQAAQKAQRGGGRMGLPPTPPRPMPEPTVPGTIAPTARPALGIPPRPDIQNRKMTNKLNMF